MVTLRMVSGSEGNEDVRLERNTGAALRQLAQRYVDGKVSLREFQVRFAVLEYQLFGTLQDYHYNSRNPDGKLAMDIGLLWAELTGQPTFSDGEFLRCVRSLLETGKCDRWTDEGWEDGLEGQDSGDNRGGDPECGR